MKIRVEYNATPYPKFDPNDKSLAKKQEIAGATFGSANWEKAVKAYGYMISITSGTAAIVAGDGRVVCISVEKLRVIDEEFLDTNPTK